MYTSSVREGEHEAEFARSAVRRVLQLKHGGGAQVRVCGGEGVWRVVKEGLEHAGVEVSRSPMGTTSRVDVSVGEDAVGASVLCVNRVGLVWLVDAHWTLAQYAEWAEALASGGLSDAWTGMLNACMGLFEVIAGIRVPDAQLALEELKKYCFSLSCNPRRKCASAFALLHSSIYCAARRKCAEALFLILFYSIIHYFFT